VLKMSMTISTYDYFKAYPEHPEITGEIHENALELLRKVNALLDDCIAQGWQPRANPATGTLISGQNNGGWRPPECTVGAQTSSHKEGRGVDIADGNAALEAMVTPDLLEKHGLYKEHPHATKGWVHLTDRAPKSGNRVFWP